MSTNITVSPWFLLVVGFLSNPTYFVDFKALF